MSPHGRNEELNLMSETDPTLDRFMVADIWYSCYNLCSTSDMCRKKTLSADLWKNYFCCKCVQGFVRKHSVLSTHEWQSEELPSPQHSLSVPQGSMLGLLPFSILLLAQLFHYNMHSTDTHFGILTSYHVKTYHIIPRHVMSNHISHHITSCHLQNLSSADSNGHLSCPVFLTVRILSEICNEFQVFIVAMGHLSVQL